MLRCISAFRTPLIALFFLAAGVRPATEAQQTPQTTPIPSIETKTEGMEKMDGFVPLYWDAKEGKIWLEIERFDQEMLHYPSLPAGLGQNNIGLNRGDLGRPHVFEFQRVGPQVLMLQKNYSYRAETPSTAERKSVEDGFPTSVLFGFKVAAETDGRVLVDATPFFVRDAMGVITTLTRSNQGTFRLDASRSAVYLPRTKAFPKNTEVEFTLTFTSDSPGAYVGSVTPTGNAMTVRQHHSFVELPDDGYVRRKADPRAGFNGITYMDYAVPLGESLTRRYIARHRIEKKDPSAAMSEPVEPIVYYVDPGTPEPIRSALLEGARWWNEAYEAAGFIDGFRVEVLPEDADPMDLRYNMIQWVHRSTRGWSYGNSITDPRTGEILKGHVTLGSLRVRQDYLLGEGLTSPYEVGDEYPTEVSDMALARIRKLSAHEVGHTIGLSHNYISSAHREAGKMSVMDYPHPLILLRSDGTIDLSQAYPVGIGDWDKVFIRYGYTHFPEGTDEDAALEDILMDAADRGLTFISDQDARPPGSAHPQVHLWDNGSSAAAELQRMMDVRRAALDRFSETAIKMGQPLATMEEALVPLYLHHRYQAEATTKVVGGLYYTYAMRGDGQEPVRAVPADEQWDALTALGRTLDPEELTIPEAILDRLPPRPFRYGPHQELFTRTTGLVFDALSPAMVASDITIQFLLHPERAARLVQQKALDPSLPGLDEVLSYVGDATFGVEPSGSYEAEVSRVVERVFVDRMMALAASARLPQVRAITTAKLVERLGWLSEQDVGVEDRAHYEMLAHDIERFMMRPLEPASLPALLQAPPGSPIGDPGWWWLRTGWDDWNRWEGLIGW